MDNLERIQTITSLFGELPTAHQRSVSALLEERLSSARTAPARRALRKRRRTLATATKPKRGTRRRRKTSEPTVEQ